MDASHYQINSERIIPKPHININFLLCALCNNILWQPEKCRECHTHFCRFCIVFSCLKSKKCPECRQDYSSKSPDSYLVEDLAELQVKCFYSYNGCTQVLRYPQVTVHEAECVYKEMPCEECGKKILKKNYHTHIVLCKNSVAENGLNIDYRQIIVYFQEKLERIEREGQDELERLKKNFSDAYSQKQTTISNLIAKMDKQRKLLEDIMIEREKIKNHDEEEMKILGNGPDFGKNILGNKTQNINDISKDIEMRKPSSFYNINSRVVQ
jgi:hypothetical protein